MDIKIKTKKIKLHTFEYICKQCGHLYKKTKKINFQNIVCRKCGGKLREFRVDNKNFNIEKFYFMCELEERNKNEIK